VIFFWSSNGRQGSKGISFWLQNECSFHPVLQFNYYYFYPFQFKLVLGRRHSITISSCFLLVRSAIGAFRSMGRLWKFISRKEHQINFWHIIIHPYHLLHLIFHWSHISWAPWLVLLLMLIFLVDFVSQQFERRFYPYIFPSVFLSCSWTLVETS